MVNSYFFFVRAFVNPLFIRSNLIVQTKYHTPVLGFKWHLNSLTFHFHGIVDVQPESKTRAATSQVAAEMGPLVTSHQSVLYLTVHVYAKLETIYINPFCLLSPQWCGPTASKDDGDGYPQSLRVPRSLPLPHLSASLLPWSGHTSTPHPTFPT